MSQKNHSEEIILQYGNVSRSYVAVEKIPDYIPSCHFYNAPDNITNAAESITHKLIDIIDAKLTRLEHGLVPTKEFMTEFGTLSNTQVEEFIQCVHTLNAFSIADATSVMEIVNENIHIYYRDIVNLVGTMTFKANGNCMINPMKYKRDGASIAVSVGCVFTIILGNQVIDVLGGHCNVNILNYMKDHLYADNGCIRVDYSQSYFECDLDNDSLGRVNMSMCNHLREREGLTRAIFNKIRGGK